MRKYQWVIVLSFLYFFTSCEQNQPCDCGEPETSPLTFLEQLNDIPAKSDSVINWIVENSVDRDLKEIQKDGVLKALVIYSSTSYFLYKGQPMGFEYELLEQLADHLDLKLELMISTDLDSEFEVLNRGDVDLIAHGMTITNQRKWEVDFTEYLYLTRQVLVQKQPDNYRNMKYGELKRATIQDAIELINDSVSIRKNSAYFERMISLSNEIGGTIYIDTLPSNLSTDEIIRKVVEEEIRYTIADENLAKINASYYPILDIEVPVSFSQRIAWVVRKKSPKLKQAINEWILSVRKSKDYNVTYNKYFKNQRSFIDRTKSDLYSLNDDKISPYDNMIREYAPIIGWDWRLYAAQIYQESRFDPKATSWAGAMGLLQMMPRTARSVGVKNLYSARQSIWGGAEYLKWLDDNFQDVPDSLTRIKFVLAAYNCGYGHMKDAQRLAEQNGLDPTKWNDHVEDMILALSSPENFNKPMIQHGYVRGIEPVNYVSEIFDRYEIYKQFIPLE